MSHFEKLLRVTARRERRRAFIVWLSRAVLWSCVVALVFRAVHEFWPLSFSTLLLVGLPLASIGTTIAVLWRRRHDAHFAAHRLDETLKGHDRFATALECTSKRHPNAVERELMKRVDSECSSIDPGRVVPIKTPREAKWLVIVLPIFLWFFTWAILDEVTLALTPIAQRTALAKPLSKIEKTIEELEKTDDPRKKAIADKLKKLMGELKDAKSLEEVMTRAKSLLEELKKSQTDPEAKKSIEMLGRIADFLSRSKMTRQVAEALRQGDLKKAADLTRTLAERIRKATGMTPQDLKRLAKNLRLSANASRNNQQSPFQSSRTGGGG